MKLVEARKRTPYTQEALAHDVEITTTQYRNIEKGRSTPSVTLAIKICKLLNVSIYDIDEWNDDIL